MRNEIDLLQDISHQTNTSAFVLLEQSHFSYIWTTLSMKKIVASHTLYLMLELEPFTEFLTMQPWRKFVHPADLNNLIQAEEKVVLTGL